MTCLSLIRFIAITSFCTGIASSGEIRQTLSLKHEFQPAESVIWSPAFQHCWDETCKFYKIESLDLDPGSPVVDELNAFTFDYKATVPFDSHLSLVTGTGEEFRKKVNTLLIRHFGREETLFEAGDFDHPQAGPAIQSVMLMSIMAHKLAFETQFEKSERPLFFQSKKNDELKAKCFGIFGENRKQNPGFGRVLAHHPEEQRLGLIFPGKNAEEEVVLISDPTIKTPLQALEMLWHWTAEFEKSPDAPQRKTGLLDTIVIPKLSLTNQSDFVSQLPGIMPLANGTFINIAAAKQRVRLKLDEKGAEMVTKAFIVAPNHLSSETPGWRNDPQKKAKPTERFFIFDRPFCFMIRKKDAKYPFVFARISGPGIVPFEKP